jgi:hypothetical protein
MATPARNDQDLWVGNHKRLEFRLWTGSTTGTTTPYPLTGIRVNVTVYDKAPQAGGTRLVLKSTDTTPTPDVVISGDSDNEILAILTPEDTRSIAEGDYAEGASPVYEVETFDGTTEKTWIWGKLKLKGGANIDE